MYFSLKSQISERPPDFVCSCMLHRPFSRDCHEMNTLIGKGVKSIYNNDIENYDNSKQSYYSADNMLWQSNRVRKHNPKKYDHFGT